MMGRIAGRTEDLGELAHRVCVKGNRKDKPDEDEYSFFLPPFVYFYLFSLTLQVETNT